MLVLLCAILLIASFAWVFFLGFRELRLGEDPLPLYINMEYKKDPRYFALSLRDLFNDAFYRTNDGKLPDGLYTMHLSKDETVEVCDNVKIPSGQTLENIYYIKNNFFSGAGVEGDKEVYAKGNADIGEKNALRAVLADNSIYVGKDTRISRWLDANGEITIEDGCNIAVSATCLKRLSLGKDCHFKRLYGFPITTSFAELAAPAKVEDVVVEKVVGRNINGIPTGSYVKGSLIGKDQLFVGSNSLVAGNIKSHGTVTLEERVTILGSMFVEGDVYIGDHCFVRGTIFSQGAVVIGENVVVGEPDKIRSVVAMKNITLNQGVRIYGYITTEGDGRTA